MPRLYLASNNRHKAEELTSLLASFAQPWEVLLAADLVPGITWKEDGETFLANAQIKAQALRAHTQEAVLADDSGLIVDALGGLPGVHSSRYAGKEGDDLANNRKLLAAIADLPPEALTAHFVTTLYLIDASGAGHAFSGRCSGFLTKTPRGQHGFGYDPLFVVGRSGRTMAELSSEEKNAVSHRGQAAKAFAAFLAVHDKSVRPI